MFFIVVPLSIKLSLEISLALGKLSSLSLPINEFIFPLGSSYFSTPLIFLT